MFENMCSAVSVRLLDTDLLGDECLVWWEADDSAEINGVLA